MTKIPVIDFAQIGLLVGQDKDVSASAMVATGQELYSALSTVGFAYLKETGIPWYKIDQMNDVADQFFMLPLEEKNNYCTGSTNFGYDPIGALRANPERPHDLHEGFRITSRGADVLWPGVPGFKDCAIDLRNLCKQLVMRILKCLAVAMELKDPDYFCKTHSLMNDEGNFSTLKAIRYPPITDENPTLDNQLRIGEHADVDSLSILFQDEVGGLQMQLPGGEFIDVHPIHDTVVLNVGETLQMWSEGRLKSAVHRVIVPEDAEKRSRTRRSIAYFALANHDVILQRLNFSNEDESKFARGEFPPVSVKEFSERRFYELFYTDRK